MVVVSATSAVVLATQPSSARVPVWVIYGCVGLAVIGFYVMLAPLMRWWPWHGTVAAFGGRALPKRIKGEQVDLAGLPPGRAIARRTFEECEIVGPGHVLLGECHVERTTWTDPEYLVVPDFDHMPPGTIKFYGCQFSKCEFSGFTAVGRKGEIEALKALFPMARARVKR